MVAIRTRIVYHLRLKELSERFQVIRSRIASRNEAGRATAYWAALRRYHKGVEEADSFERSRWVAERVAELGIRSLLEVGCNTGRNLAVVKKEDPEVRTLGIDVNRRALAFARTLHPEIEFRRGDAHRWTESPNSWDAILTMSVLDHIPDDAAEVFAANVLGTARYVISVELWDGSPGDRGLYKYSRDTRALFERHGATTLMWAELPCGQYDTENSLLWAYIGESSSRAGPSSRTDGASAGSP